MDELLGILLPLTCAGCGAWDVPLCVLCKEVLLAPLRRCEAGAPAIAGFVSPGGSARARGPGSSAFPPGGAASAPAALPTWCIAAYSDPARGVVLTWKGVGERNVARAVLAAGERAGGRLAVEPEVAEVVATRRLVVVPAPSGWRRRTAGRFVVGSLATSVARGIIGGIGDAAESERGGPRVVVADALRRSRGSAHQSGLGAARRSTNRRGSMRLARRIPPRSTCLLVDDVLTTGATLAECRRTLESVGHEVVGAFVLAAAAGPRGDTQGSG